MTMNICTPTASSTAMTTIIITIMITAITTTIMTMPTAKVMKAAATTAPAAMKM